MILVNWVDNRKLTSITILNKPYFSGEFLRIRTNSLGEAFKITVDFDSPILTRPFSNYSLSMYTLINCPKEGCEEAQDKISVQIKEGVNGVYKEVILIKGRVRDDRWKRDSFDFIATKDRVYVC
jgi:hypothetical protein